MMPPSQTAPETIILVDNLDLFSAAIKALRSKDYKAQVTDLASGGTGFTRSHRFEYANRCCNLLYLAPDNAHPFAYLTLGQRAMAVPMERVICIGQAVDLDFSYTLGSNAEEGCFPEKLRPGDMAIISEASALPYPALYESQPPPWQTPAPLERERRITENYPLTEASLIEAHALADFMQPSLWQKRIPVIRSGYAKHPTHGGALTPWAPEQFDRLRDSGIGALAELPTGAAEFSRENPSIPVIAFAMITATASETSTRDRNGAPPLSEWQRYRHKLLHGGLQLILSSISHEFRAGNLVG